MYTNDLNSAYLYESERRADEMRAAQESQIAIPTAKNRRKEFFTLIVLVLLILVWVAL